MSKRRKYFLVFSFLLLDMALVVGFLTLRDATMLNKLTKEVNELLQLNITKDRYNRDIVTKGNYAVVEKSMKEYLDESAVKVQDIILFIDSSPFTKILSYDNYLKDGPSFHESLFYLEEEKITFNEKIDSALDSLEEESIQKYILTKTKDSYSIELYDRFMIEDSFKDTFSEIRQGLVQVRDVVNHNMDVSYEVLLFLGRNQDSWKLEEGEIQFSSQEKYDEYNRLTSSLSSR